MIGYNKILTKKNLDLVPCYKVAVVVITELQRKACRRKKVEAEAY